MSNSRVKLEVRLTFFYLCQLHAAIPRMSNTRLKGCVAPTGLHFGANFAGAKDATAADAAGVDESTATALRFGQGVSHRTQGPGSLPSFLA